MEPRVTSREARSANIFTPQKRFSAFDHWNWQASAGDGRTSDRASNTLRLVWNAKPWLAGSEKLSAVEPTQPQERWGFPAGSERPRAVPGESQPTFRPRSHSERSQIPETLCPCHRGCEQKRGWPAATSPTSAARFPLSRRACRALLRTEPPTCGASEWPNPGQIRQRTGREH